jgi:mannose-6-phosphate isomerase-like protein (cupin superfamily)
MIIRRVATGTSPTGRSVIALDEHLKPLTASALPGYVWHKLWGFDQLPTDPATATATNRQDHFPPPGGVRFNLFTVPPNTTSRPPLTPERARELDEKLPGRSSHMESDQAGLHRTASVDFVLVLAGEICLDLDDGVTVDLKAGDSLVQNGTRHAWRNRTNQPCRLVIVLIGTAGPT